MTGLLTSGVLAAFRLEGDVVRKLALAGCVVMAAGLLTVPAAHAFPPRLPPGRSKHVCSFPIPGAVRCHAIIRTDDNLNALTTTAPAGYGPGDLRNAYNITANGTGTIAIVDAYRYPNAEADLAVYRAQFGLPPCTSANGCFLQLNEHGQLAPLPGYDFSWSQEQALDLDMASAICPGCKLILLEANSNSFADMSTTVASAGRRRPHAISNSYGGPEMYSRPAYAASYNIAGLP